MAQPIVGVDLGGTKIEVALADQNGRILARHRTPTPPGAPPNSVIAGILRCVKECLDGRKAAALGMGVAGQVDAASGIVRYAPNLNWRDVPLRAELQEALGFPVLVVNDVRAAGFGEWKYGAAQTAENMVCLFIGTGIGGGIVVKGQMLEGCSNTAGELGHVTIVAGGRPCKCPNLGCLEATRQKLPVMDPEQYPILSGVARGGYILKDAESGKPDLILISTGSEVQLILAARDKLLDQDVQAGAISMPSWELFDAQPLDYRRQVLPPEIPKLAVEAGVSQGWREYVGDSGDIIALDRFGASAPGEVVMHKLGLNVENVVSRAIGLVRKR
ncbi:MAG: ROK family protein [Acidobacteriota bacterium]